MLCFLQTYWNAPRSEIIVTKLLLCPLFSKLNILQGVTIKMYFAVIIKILYFGYHLPQI